MRCSQGSYPGSPVAGLFELPPLSATRAATSFPVSGSYRLTESYSRESHVCVVLHERTAEHLASQFGIEPFIIRVPRTPASKATVRGESEAYILKFGYAQAVQ